MSVSHEVHSLSATEMAHRVRRSALSPVEVARAMLDRVDAVNPRLNALVQCDRDQVLAEARELERAQRGHEPLGPLHGVPFTIKDLTAVEGLPLTFGMRPLQSQVADRDAAVVSRLREAGGLFLGKTNTPESGYYGGTDNHLFGPTHNPWKKGHTPGGSSGGAAAAVASGMGPLAEGSDGAGSVRIPSSLCGVVGFKPSVGRIPQTLLPGRFNTFLHHGPITRTVADNALMLQVLAGESIDDPLSLPNTSEDYSPALWGDVRGLRVAWSPDLGFGDVDPEVAEVCQQAVSVFEELGAVVEHATPDWGDPEEAMWHGIWVPAYAAEHDMLDCESWRGQVDDYLIDLMREGEQLRALDVGRADAYRGRMWDIFTRFMGDFDLLVSPTLTSAAFPLEQFAPQQLMQQSLRRQILGWVLTYPYNMLTTPAITVPAGLTHDRRPVGLQIAGRLHADATVLRAAAAVEEARPWSLDPMQ